MPSCQVDNDVPAQEEVDTNCVIAMSPLRLVPTTTTTSLCFLPSNLLV